MSDLDDILNGDENTAEPAIVPDDNTNNLENAPEPNLGVEFSTLEVGGVKIKDGFITDQYGNSWQVPGGNVEDLDDLYAGDIYKIPEKLSKDFHVQMIRLDQLKEYCLRGFVPVLQEELEIPRELIKNTGSPIDSYHVVGDSVMVKIPQVIRERLEQRKIAETKRRLREMEPSKDMLKRAGQDGVFTTLEHKSSADVLSNPNNRQGTYADNQGKV